MTWISVLALLFTLFVKSPNLCEPVSGDIESPSLTGLL